ncbi:ComEC/Rec2 family competence protein [Formosa haliotis]|uniref:ComEC/Rec2 family competence protein n=1 Tax=Formosa haliotis TaxID=1555194 RepID=UPI000824184D|nr:ComEC/Rec2 family competence protein [Formosa haliotis]
MKLFSFILVKLTLLIILGICFGHAYNIPLFWSLLACALLLVLLGSIWFSHKTNFKPPASFGITAFILTFFIGVFTVNVHNEKLQKSHYSRLNTESNKITIKIREVLKPNAYYDKYIVEILKINNEKVTGTSLLNIKKDTLTRQFKIDDVFLTTEKFQEITPPLNPNQFDYKAYLERRYIYHQIVASPNQLLKLAHNHTSLLGVAYKVNTFVRDRLQQYSFGNDQLAVLHALLLGQRQDLSETLYKNYTKAGAVHILAVSGLHVGILLLILNFLFKPIERVTHGKVIKTICIVALMWCFAFLTGLSPSVSRATLMFTLVAISLNSNRPTNIYNTLAISAFLLLLWNPLLLYDVGFQLSYLAVLSIVTFQPLFYKLWIPKHKLTNILWNTTTVTFAAQIGVLPVSLFYFHQFPGLFFLSNLIIVPLLGYILGFGILVNVLATLQLLPPLLVLILNKTIGFMNGFVTWVASQDQFIFDSISIKLNSVLAIYLLILCLIYVYTTPKFKSVAFVLLACITLQLTFIYNRWQVQSQEWILFHKNRESILAERKAYSLFIHSTSDSSLATKQYPLKSYIISNEIKRTATTPLKSVYNVLDKRLLVVDSSAVYTIKGFNPHYIVLSNSPKVNLNRLIDSLVPKQIIADGSNYKSYISRWETTCKNKKIPFYQTGKKGAFLFNR